MTFCRSNIGPKGRLVRAAGAISLGAAAVLTLPHSRVTASALAASALFVGFEAARGWCALRACGLKTKF